MSAGFSRTASHTAPGMSGAVWLGLASFNVRSYAAAKAEIMPDVLHRQDKRSNIHAENSHQPTRERERRMRGFKSAGHAQRFLSSFGVIATLFRPSRHLLSAGNCRAIMRDRSGQWSPVNAVNFVFQ